MAACRLASKGKTMADSGYDAEVSGIQAFLSMQHDKGDATPLSPGQVSWCSIFSMFWHALTKLTERTGKLCVENGLKKLKKQKNRKQKNQKKLRREENLPQKAEVFLTCFNKTCCCVCCLDQHATGLIWLCLQSSSIRLGISRQSVTNQKLKPMASYGHLITRVL